MVVTEERARELATMPYADYLRTPEWQAKRLAALARAGHRCQVCNGRERLQAHHRTYERRGCERDDDLIVLCDGCHDLYHQAGRLAEGEAGGVRPVPVVEAVAWQAPLPVRGSPPHRRPPPRLVRRLRWGWQDTAPAVRLAWALILAGAGLVLVLAGKTAT